VLIGREADCECQLTHTTVSARHAQLSFHHQQWWLDDLNSTNGTKLNREPVETSTVIVNGDEISCGEVTMEIIIKTEIPEKTGGSDE